MTTAFPALELCSAFVLLWFQHQYSIVQFKFSIVCSSVNNKTFLKLCLIVAELMNGASPQMFHQGVVAGHPEINPGQEKNLYYRGNKGLLYS